MIVKELRSKDFRGMGELVIPFHPQMNVLVGVNGSGKSAILDCLATVLSQLMHSIFPEEKKSVVRHFSPNDITNGKRRTDNAIKVWEGEGEDVCWNLTKRRTGRSDGGSQTEQYARLVKKIHSELQEEQACNLPLAVYYQVNRAVPDPTPRLPGEGSLDRRVAYKWALAGAHRNFRLFFEWFRWREDIENEKRLQDGSHRDRQLQAVRAAIERFLPGFKELRVRRSPLRMSVSKRGEELIVSQLSDGEKCLLAMVGDLARRLAIANPHLELPHEGTAVVLVDEIDLHLHASWQRTIVEGLRKAFPNCQFVLTTHSPQIVSEVPAECVIGLHRTKAGVRIVQHEETYGLDSNRILEEVLGVDERPRRVKKALQKLFLAIEDGDIAGAYRQLEKLQAKIGSDPQLAKADAMIRRKEILAG